MDWTQASVIEHSLKDVIDILQSKPVQRDLEPGIEIARMMNRVAIAHLSIERAMKFLIKEAESGNGFPHTHRLSCLYEKLKQDDPNSVEFLDHEFEKAVRFFNYNPNSSEQSHFVSLSEYLGKVGGADAFNEMRYWEVGVQEINEMVNRTSLTVKIHLEILHALYQLVSYGREQSRCVTMRVEQLICEHLRDSYNKYHFTNKMHIFIDWRNNYDSCSNAMSDAIKKDFNIGISHMSQIVKSAYDKLMESGDNAVLYFLETSKILPSQQVEFPFSPCFNWLNSQETCGSVKTPSGSPLGIICQRYDGFWLINPSANNLLEYMLANNKIDAIRYLVTSFIKPVLITINDQNHTIYLVKYDSNSTEGHSTRVTEPYQFHFWDDSHNIELGQHIKLQINENDSPWIETFEGKVTDVQSEKITLECQRRLS